MLFSRQKATSSNAVLRRTARVIDVILCNPETSLSQGEARRDSSGEEGGGGGAAPMFTAHAQAHRGRVSVLPTSNGVPKRPFMFIRHLHSSSKSPPLSSLALARLSHLSPLSSISSLKYVQWPRLHVFGIAYPGARLTTHGSTFGAAAQRSERLASLDLRPDALDGAFHFRAARLRDRLEGDNEADLELAEGARGLRDWHAHV